MHNYEISYVLSTCAGPAEAGPVDPHHHWVLEMVHTLSIFQETSSLSVNHNFYPIVVPDE